jgi:hypothetical protein
MRSSKTCKKHITTVFWDISGFSKLSKMFYLMDSKNIFLEFLEEYYTIARCIIAHKMESGLFEKNALYNTVGMTTEHPLAFLCYI